MPYVRTAGGEGVMGMELSVTLTGGSVAATTARADADRGRDLVERAKHDREAFATLYRAHCRAIAGYIYRRVGDTHLAEDLASEVFMVALQHLGSYRHRGVPIRAWLYRIASSRVNRWARRQRRTAIDQLHADPPVGDPAATPGGLTADFARKALLTLAPKHQAVLALHYLEGLPLDQVAIALGCRMGTVKSRLSRGREALRQRLSERRS